MKTTPPRPFWQLTTLLSTLLLLGSSACFAQNKALTISNRTQLDFGTISSENGTCSMNNQGNLTGTGGQSCFGSGTVAEFRVSGDSGYSFFVTTTGSSNNGITIVPAVAGSSSYVLTSRSKFSIYIVGDLVLNNASAGNFGLSYLVSVNYE